MPTFPTVMPTVAFQDTPAGRDAAGRLLRRIGRRFTAFPSSEALPAKLGSLHWMPELAKQIRNQRACITYTPTASCGTATWIEP